MMWLGIKVNAAEYHPIQHGREASLDDRVSTGHVGLDQAIDMLRLGDNVVWQVNSLESYQQMVDAYIHRAVQDGRNIVYVRFGSHPPLLAESEQVKVYRLDPDKGFESFATAVHLLIEREGKRTFYVFDSLTDLLEYWHSDLMIGNFFKVACPYLYELDTVAYFAILRNVHTYSTIARIRETTQVLFDLYEVKGKHYVHPLKVENRYSPTMFFPHRLQGQEAISLTASADVAELFASIRRGEERLDYWDTMINKARELVGQPKELQDAYRKRLIRMLLGQQSRMIKLCEAFFTLEDIVMIADRQVGSGWIGGKSVGMLLARKILEQADGGRFRPYLEPHDSYYIGTDVFYTYIVQNGWWKLRTKQKTAEGYFEYAPELQEKLLHGRFPDSIREKFMQLLEHFGQSPIIVRSSSLLEDNFGNAFAGKYESVFCANQGTPKERYEAFEQAIRIVYASSMNRDALEYRMSRGLFAEDEQMAILVQRVSGDHYGDEFYPHLAGVGNSKNLYVWDPEIDMNAGMLRLVFGLGTRAVDRTEGDYARLVTLDNPSRLPLVHAEDRKRFSQHLADVISLSENQLVTRRVDACLNRDIKVDPALFASVDHEVLSRMRELGIKVEQKPYVLDLHRLLTHTDFPAVMRDMLQCLSRVYDYPVDIEFTANFTENGRYKINIVQCRPLQTKGLGRKVTLPKAADEACLFAMQGNFMGGNVRLSIDYTVLVRSSAYLQLSEQDKHAVARLIGQLNRLLIGRTVMLIGPGRWGTTTPSLGVPVKFAEINHVAVLVEAAEPEEGFMPELSYGSHFFQDLVETGIFYAAVFAGQPGVIFRPERILHEHNQLTELLPQYASFHHVVHVAETPGMELYSDIVSQRVICV
jgi:KaiC/GvpD/RAD55 family RecA-like ATPase